MSPSRYAYLIAAVSAWTPWGRVEVRAAALGEEAALLGAPPLLSGEARGR